MEKTDHADSALIDLLGGTSAVARICKVKQPSVSQWRKDGIPSARRQFLELLRPDVFRTNAAGRAERAA
jgi:phage terminase Nu1 subunit (DNA packaging protein)